MVGRAFSRPLLFAGLAAGGATQLMSRMRLVAPVVVLVVLVGCSSSSAVAPSSQTDANVDASGEVGGDDGGSDGPACLLVSAYSSQNKVCNDCAQSKCCAEVDGCLGDTRCNDDYVNCSLACALTPDDAGADADAAGAVADCVAKCGTDFPVGKAEYDTAIGCVDAKCATECQ